mgnify:CR=1 FL=1
MAEQLIEEKGKISVYEIIKAKLIEKMKVALESGEQFTWAKPWRGAPYPCNYDAPRQPFKAAINRLLLETGEYLTFWQINKLHEEDPEIRIRKGAKQAYVFQSFPVFKKDEDGKILTDDNGELLIDRFCMRYSREFHISDVTGLKSHFVEKEYIHDKTESMRLADQLIEEYCRKYQIDMQILYGSGRAYFRQIEYQTEDFADGREKIYFGKISLPDAKQFEHMSEYYSTIFHELAHSTKVAIDRGKLSYAQEELVAEVSASLTCASLNLIDEGSLKNNAAYLQSWMKQIEKEEARDIYFAVADAQKATDLILHSSPMIFKKLFPDTGIIDEPSQGDLQENRGYQIGGMNNVR